VATSVVQTGRHSCDLPFVSDYEPGTVVECDDCGRQWKNKQPGNPEYARWSRTWFRRGRDPVQRRLSGNRVLGGTEFVPPPPDTPGPGGPVVK